MGSVGARRLTDCPSGRAAAPQLALSSRGGANPQTARPSEGTAVPQPANPSRGDRSQRDPLPAAAPGSARPRRQRRPRSAAGEGRGLLTPPYAQLELRLVQVLHIVAQEAVQQIRHHRLQHHGGGGPHCTAGRGPPGEEGAAGRSLNRRRARPHRSGDGAEAGRARRRAGSGCAAPPGPGPTDPLAGALPAAEARIEAGCGSGERPGGPSQPPWREGAALRRRGVSPGARLPPAPGGAKR